LWQVGKNGRKLLDRPKPTVGCSANGRRRRRRPRKRWNEETEGDLQVLGVRRWREFVADRKKWKDIVGQAKAHSGM
jgi:hypothetical protein